MNTNELLDKVFEILEGTDSKDTVDGEFNIDDINDLLEEDEKSFRGYKLIPEFYEKIGALTNKKELILSALESSNEDRRTIGNMFLEISPLSFLSADEIDKLLDSDELKKLNLDDHEVIVSLIHASGNIEKYFTPERMKKFDLHFYDIIRLIETSGDIDKYLTPENIKKLHLSASWDTVDLIKASGNIEKYLTPERVKQFDFDSYQVIALIEASGNKEKYLTPENVKQFGFELYQVIDLIKASGNIEKYLTPENMKQFGFNIYQVVDIIKASGNVEKYLTPERVKQFGFEINQVVELIEASGNIEKYLTPENVKKFGLEPRHVAWLIEASGNIEKYLTPENEEQYYLYNGDLEGFIKVSKNIEKYLTLESIKQFNLSSFDIVRLIEASGNIEKYLTPESLKRFGLETFHAAELIKASGNIEKYLTPENVEKFHLNFSDVQMLIEVIQKHHLTPECLIKFGVTGEDIVPLIKCGDIEEYLTPENVKRFGLEPQQVRELIEASGDIEKYLTPENVKQFGLEPRQVVMLIKASGKIEKYLTLENVNKFHLDSGYVVMLIEASGKTEEYLTAENVEKFALDSESVAWLIKVSGKIEEYLTLENIEKFHLTSWSVLNLIKATGKIEEYLTPEKVEKLHLSFVIVENLIKATGNIEKYLTPENVEKLHLNSYSVADLIQTSGKIGEYLTPENVKNFHLKSEDVAGLIKATRRTSEYLTLDKVKEYNLSGKDIVFIIGITSLKNSSSLLSRTLDDEIANGTYTYEKILKLLEFIKSIEESNSGKLNRISDIIIEQIINLPVDEWKQTANSIRRLYETTDIPLFAQNFLVFKQLHSNFIGEENLADNSYREFGNIPSLNNASPKQRSNIIFSDLAKISVESNSRDLEKYLNTIEKGDKLFEMFKDGKLQLDDTLSEDDRIILKKYSNMLNTLYNQTSKGKRLAEARVNSGNLEQDLTELNVLLNSNENIHIPLRDRIVRTFGYWTGIRSFEQAKKMIEEATKEADKANRERAEKGKFSIKKGDLVKGISATQYFPKMLQNGIVAKDYLGESATYDLTPLDTDVELIQNDEKMFTAPGYTNGNVDGKALGKIILVMKNDGRYVKTRYGKQVDEEALKEVIEDRTKIEYFDNNGEGGTNAHGIRTGIGSTNISFIIADRYVDKLGLEIAMNGFYIPIIDKDNNLLYTPEMYDEIRSRMQGLSNYGLNEFQLDSSAKNIGTSQIAHVIRQSKEDAENKREAILQTLRGAIESYGLNMSEKRTEDLLQGIVEIIDTGSTGRGTNLPGDGDFDFMVRIDGKILNNSHELKQLLEKSLSTLDTPDEDVVTAKGDFRFKGVSIEGLKDKVDIDLSFTKRTDEIEYTTEECIKDRLETIRKNSSEDYEYVVANILLAKTVLKFAGAYKKKSSPEPQDGKKDTRGGLGAVGIENWILQNGGSFEKAARDFLKVAKGCNGLSDFQKKYAIWDFGENYMAGDHYSHDNFVYNMNDKGYSNMVNALEDYIRTIENERKVESEKKGLGELVQEDISVLNDTQYMMAVEKILESAKHIEETKEQESVTK